MSNKKKTINTNYEELIAIVKNANIPDEVKAEKVAFLEGRIEVNTKKNASGGEKKLSKTQEENAVYKAEILAEMESGKSYTITDMMKALPTCAELGSPNKVNALVKQLKDCGKVVRSEVKGKAYFTKVENEGE